MRFAQPAIGEEEIREVIDTLQSGWLTGGPKVECFERDFERFLGGSHAVAVSSATAGLHLALEALNVGPGDEVIIPTHTFTATAEAVRYTGATPVLVDIDPHTLCISLERAEHAITPRTRALLPVHFGGRAAPMKALTELAAMHWLSIVEDAAHALPELRGDIAVYSFHANKPITTGEGGMLVTRWPDIAKRARLMRLHGINAETRDGWKYEVTAPGYKYNMPEIAAALGICQLRKVAAGQVAREYIARCYSAAFAALPIQLPPPAAFGETHSWHLYVIQVPDREKFLSRLKCPRSVHYIPLHRQPYWRDSLKLRPEMFPVSESVYQRSVSLPIYPTMSMGDIEHVIDAVKAAL